MEDDVEIILTPEHYRQLVEIEKLLKEIRQQMIEKDFMHWRHRGRQVWINKIDSLLGPSNPQIKD